MPSAPDPYVNAHPGDLITAQLFNGLQSTIRQDIADQVKKAIDALKTVDNSGDSAKLGGKTPKELEDEIVQRALAEIPKRTGYRMIFKKLDREDEAIIEHQLHAFPLVDLYQLDYFQVICATGEEKADQQVGFVNFYLYHSDETSFADPNSPIPIQIEPTDRDEHAFTIDFEKLLALYDVKYTDESNLRELETEFWKAFFKSPNDKFDRRQFCHSPWFEKCCGQRRTVGYLKAGGDWDDIQFQMRPRKVVHFAASPPPPSPVMDALPSALADIQVVHFDFDTIGVRLMSDPIYPQGLREKVVANQLKVMLLLKV